MLLSLQGISSDITMILHSHNQVSLCVLYVEERKKE